MKSYLLKWWQPLYVALATSWLFAPALNNLLIHRSALISEFEAPHQSYSYLFRLCDILAGLLLLVVVNTLRRQSEAPRDWAYWLISIIAIGSMIDSLIPATCVVSHNICHIQKDAWFFVHASETVITSSAIGLTALLDWLKRGAMPSKLFVLFQIIYGAIALVSINSSHQTLLQFSYELVFVVWIAWFVQHYWGAALQLADSTKRVVRAVAAAWAAINGVASILLSFEHLRDQRILDHFYFGSNTPWLAQHGIIVGLALLYISRHLYRGELRARQIFLVIIAIEISKYSVLSPNPLILGLYLGSFIAVFAAPVAFTRKSATMTPHTRLIDLLIIVSGVAIATIAGTAALQHNQHGKVAISHINRGYASVRTHLPNPRFNEIDEIADNQRFVLVSETLLIGTVVVALASLFQPRKIQSPFTHSTLCEEADDLLRQYSTSTEDYFKLWPIDKQYFWAEDKQGFIAYKPVRSVAFALADPIAKDRAAQDKLLKDFIKHCRGSGWKACFLLVTEDGRELYQNNDLTLLNVGSSAEVNVKKFTETTVRNKWWRWQTNKNQKAGYQFRVSQPPHSNTLLSEVERISDMWLTRPSHREQSFAMGYYDRDYMNRSEICYLEQNGRAVAFANLLPTLRPLKRATIDLMRFNPEHHGVMSYLLSETIQHVAQDDSIEVFDLGFVPFAKTDNALARIVRLLGRQRFSAAGLTQFKNKFEPDWQPNYAAYDGDLLDSGSIAANLEELLKK